MDSVRNQPLRPAQPFIPMGAINQVPALAGVEAGVTSAGWQLTLWHAISRISDVSWTHRYASLNYVANRKCNNVTTDYSMWWWFSTHHIWLSSTALATRHLLLRLLLWFTDWTSSDWTSHLIGWHAWLSVVAVQRPIAPPWCGHMQEHYSCMIHPAHMLYNFFTATKKLDSPAQPHNIRNCLKLQHANNTCFGFCYCNSSRITVQAALNVLWINAFASCIHMSIFEYYDSIFVGTNWLHKQILPVNLTMNLSWQRTLSSTIHTPSWSVTRPVSSWACAWSDWHSTATCWPVLSVAFTCRQTNDAIKKLLRMCYWNYFVIQNLKGVQHS